MTDNVILFPKFKKDSPPQSVEDIVDQIAQTRKDHVDSVLNDLIPEFMHLFASYGVDVSSENYVKDAAMIVESMKAMLHRQFNLDHPFHKMVDNLFEFGYNEDNTIAYTYTIPTEEE